MVELGAREAIMTMPDGCFAHGASRSRRPAALPRCASSRSSRAPTVGSGDAFLAGYVAARYSGRPPAECLRFGVACGAESTQHLGAGVDPRGSSGWRRDQVERVAQPAEVG